MKSKMSWACVIALMTGAVAFAQPASLEFVPPAMGTMTFGVDRTAFEDSEDIGYAYRKAALHFSDPVGEFTAYKLLPGSKLRLRVLSYQMWLLEHPKVRARKDIPQDTNRSGARFTLTFLSGVKVLSQAMVDTTREIDDREEEKCEVCNGSINPAHFVLEAPVVDIPKEATAVLIRLSHTIDRSTGGVTSVQGTSVAQSLSNVFSLRGKQTVRPRDESTPQFQMVAGSEPRVGAEFKFDEKRPMDARWYSLIHHDKAISDTFEAILGEKFELSRIRTKHIGLWVRSGPALPWDRLMAGSYDIPPVNSTYLEFIFLYSMSAVKANGDEVQLGTFYDSPTGDISRGWVINLIP